MMIPTLEEVRALFAKDLFATAQAGITVEEIGEQYAKCRMPVTPQHRNAAGAVMGGAIYTLADFAFAVAANLGGVLTVTTTASVSFVGTCKGEILYAETRLIKDGRRSCFFEVTVTDELGNLVAVVTSNGMHLEKKL
ncbi:MAG: PaaI family thioesterase [Clostridia bacterium]|nr:PaaI family thioesterase [Clostridia bacterium]